MRWFLSDNWLLVMVLTTESGHLIMGCLKYIGHPYQCIFDIKLPNPNINDEMMALNLSDKNYICISILVYISTDCLLLCRLIVSSVSCSWEAAMLGQGNSKVDRNKSDLSDIESWGSRRRGHLQPSTTPDYRVLTKL